MRGIAAFVGAMIFIGGIGQLSETAGEIVAGIFIAGWIGAAALRRWETVPLPATEPRERERIELHLHLKERD